MRLGVNEAAAVWAQRSERGLVRIATVTLLEVGYSARDATDLDNGLHEPPVGSLPIEYATPIAEDRAVNVLKLLAARGPHRAPSIPDLIIAAIAESAGLVVLHNDTDFVLIAEMTGQHIQRLAA